ncbi:MAG: hypothetical protein ACJAT4_002723 [Granulosicoccus sp.]|jgi:hypothetical protein
MYCYIEVSDELEVMRDEFVLGLETFCRHSPLITSNLSLFIYSSFQEIKKRLKNINFEPLFMAVV